MSHVFVRISGSQFGESSHIIPGTCFTLVKKTHTKRSFNVDIRPSKPIRVYQWHHMHPNGNANHRPLDCLLNSVFQRITKPRKHQNSASLLSFEGNPHVAGWFTWQRAIGVENFSILWRHHHVVEIVYNERVLIFQRDMKHNDFLKIHSGRHGLSNFTPWNIQQTCRYMYPTANIYTRRQWWHWG